MVAELLEAGDGRQNPGGPLAVEQLPRGLGLEEVLVQHLLKDREPAADYLDDLR